MLNKPFIELESTGNVLSRAKEIRFPWHPQEAQLTPPRPSLHTPQPTLVKETIGSLQTRRRGLSTAASREPVRNQLGLGAPSPNWPYSEHFHSPLVFLNLKHPVGEQEQALPSR